LRPFNETDILFVSALKSVGCVNFQALFVRKLRKYINISIS